MEQEQIKQKLNQLFQGIDNRTNQVKDATENLSTIAEHLNQLPKPPGIDVDSLIRNYSDGLAEIIKGNRQIMEAKGAMQALLNQQQ